MQKMAPSTTDTHDHGPPASGGPSPSTPAPFPSVTKSALHEHTPYPKLAIWSTSLPSASVNSFSGAVAGMASGIVTCPLDVIKTKLQAQGAFSHSHPSIKGSPSSALYHGLLGTARTIVKQDGLVGLYRGLGPMLLGYLPTWAVYMSVYDGSREYFYSHGYGEKEADKWVARVLASVTAGGCSTLVTNPIWVIKTRLMSQVSKKGPDSARTPWQYSSTLDAFRKMYKAEGVGAFYSGLGPALLGLTHVAIQFPLYEYFKQRFTGVEMGVTKEGSGEPAKNTAGILAATFLSKVCATSATYPHEVLRTRLQTQQRHIHMEHDHSGIGAGHHSQSITSTKRISNTDGIEYQPKYKGIIRTFQIILREEGWRAFYNGMGTNMIRAVPAAMTTMLTFETIKGLINKLQDEGRTLKEEQGLV